MGFGFMGFEALDLRGLGFIPGRGFPARCHLP